jgi:microcystin degradation protein MlrC
MHESNTFAGWRTPLDAFRGREQRGREILESWRETHHEVAGFIRGICEGPGDEEHIHPTRMSHATPGGPVTVDAFATLTEELVGELQAAPKPDGMLLACHGAMVSEEYPDADGEIIRRVREALGPDVPLVVTLDFHANISQKMLDYSTALVVYRTNPHIDQAERGLTAARLLIGMIHGEVRPVQALAKPPMVWNILHQNTSRDPLRSIMQNAKQAGEPQNRNPVLVANVAAGYPYADVEEMGPSAVVVTDGDPELARREADRLAEQMWAARDRLRIDLPGPAAAVERAVAAERPVVLVDMGDNIGGGSPGDSTFLLEEIVRQKRERGALGAVVVLYDPEAAAACAAVGIGAEVRLEAGGKVDRMHGAPVGITGRVRSLHDGSFYEPEPRHGGATRWNQGLTAVVELPPYHPEPWRQALVVLNSRRTAPMSLHQLTSLGIRPEQSGILVVKAAIAYRAAYEPVAATIIEVDSPGVTAVNPRRFEYQHVRRPLWPLP